MRERTMSVKDQIKGLDNSNNHQKRHDRDHKFPNLQRIQEDQSTYIARRYQSRKKLL